MAELSLNQITEKLNQEFTGEARKLVFWYDDNGDFEHDVDTIQLENAKVYHLTKTNQFMTKVFLERQDTTGNYLIYAPFPKPPVEQNHLEDTLLYSRRFYADRASLISVDLGIDERYKPILQKYIQFFANKERTKRFYDLELENFTEDTIEIALMSALCRSKTAAFEEVVRILLTGEDLENSPHLAEFERFGLLNAFWKQCETAFGYADAQPTLGKLVATLFVTDCGKTIKTELPRPWKPFVAYKPGNVITFLDNLANNVLYRQRYDELALRVESGLQAVTALASCPPEALLECDAFPSIDQILIHWMIVRLADEDSGATLDGNGIPAICEKRRKLHYGQKFKAHYDLLESAWYLIGAAAYQPPASFGDIVKQYLKEDYRIDAWYRRFINSFDELEDPADFESLKELVENIYSNEYLSKLLPAWNQAMTEEEMTAALPLQRNFYNAQVKHTRERLVVIISDGMRYEVGQSLYAMMQGDPKCTSVKLEAQLSVLPSYTQLGMAALLPHKTLELTDDFHVLADGQRCDNLEQRQKILCSNNPKSVCVQFDELKGMKQAELRGVLTGQEVVYVYHNQIDARGDKANTENEVFQACEEAVSEIAALIRTIASKGNTIHFLVTADHGFLYKRNALTESDRIHHAAGKNALVSRRFIVAPEALDAEGVASMNVGAVLGTQDQKIISWPVGPNVFKAGGSLNYVHGGSSPQEMLVPVLRLRMEKSQVDTHPVQINLVSIVRKITNLITSLDFVQTEPVSDVATKTTFRVFFVSEDNEHISNEAIFAADSRNEDPAKRIFRQRFTFKNRKYDKNKRYYLVAMQAVDEKTELEVFRQEIVMDIAFADDFGFGV